MANKLNSLIEKELTTKFPAGSSVVVMSYTKLTGVETTELRKTLRDNKIQMEVVKNTIAARALQLNGLGAANVFLQGSCALVSGNIEAPKLCQVVTECAKKYENRVIVRGAVIDNAAINPAGVGVIASIPPMPVLQARFLGSVQAPISRMAGAFQAVMRGLACALEGIREQKEKSTPPPAPEAAASGAATSPA